MLHAGLLQQEVYSHCRLHRTSLKPCLLFEVRTRALLSRKSGVAFSAHALPFLCHSSQLMNSAILRLSKKLLFRI